MFGGAFFGARFFGGRYFGKVGLTVPGYYTGSQYFGNSYFGRRYFGASQTSIPFELVTTNTPALSVVVQVNGNVASGIDFGLAVTAGLSLSGVVSTSGALLYEGDDWAFTPPLAINQLTGAVLVAGDVAFTLGATEAGSYFGGGYFGSAYFGRRYWATKSAFALAATNTIALSGTAQVAGDLTASSAIVQSGAVALSGTVGVAGDLTFPSLIQHSGAVFYIPIRMVSGLWSATGITASANLENLQAWLPPRRQPMGWVTIGGTRYPVDWDDTLYRFLQFVSEIKLGGIAGPTLPDVVTTVTETQATAAAASASVTELAQQTTTNAEALAATVQVVTVNSLSGANQIPQVSLRY
jgi:hypothetical protein